MAKLLLVETGFDVKMLQWIQLHDRAADPRVYFRLIRITREIPIEGIKRLIENAALKVIGRRGHGIIALRDHGVAAAIDRENRAARVENVERAVHVAAHKGRGHGGKSGGASIVEGR